MEKKVYIVQAMFWDYDEIDCSSCRAFRVYADSSAQAQDKAIAFLRWEERESDPEEDGVPVFPTNMFPDGDIGEQYWEVFPAELVEEMDPINNVDLSILWEPQSDDYRTTKYGLGLYQVFYKDPQKEVKLGRACSEEQAKELINNYIRRNTKAMFPGGSQCFSYKESPID